MRAEFLTPAQFYRETNCRKTLETFAVADDADCNSLNGHRVAPQIDLDRLELGVFGHQLDRVAAPAQALDRDLVGEARDDDLPGRGAPGLGPAHQAPSQVPGAPLVQARPPHR